MKTIYFMFAILVLAAPLAKAQRVGVSLNLEQIGVNGDTGVDISSNAALGAGALFYHPFNEKFQLRTGAIYSQQSFDIKVASNDTNLKIAKLNLPVTAGLSLGEQFQVFAGPILSLTVDKSCETSGVTTCSVSGFKVPGSDIALSLGAQFLLTSELGMEMSIEKMGTNPFNQASPGTSVSINFQYIIE